MSADEPQNETNDPGGGHRAKGLAALSLAATGIVYGDIGTSPLYAFREAFAEQDAVPVSEANVLGVLSLVFWALIVVVTLKYVTFLMRADNQGEGGVFALLALIKPWREEPQTRRTKTLLLVGLFGAALLYGDGIITPAISVLSAVEGLTVAAPGLSPAVVPVTAVILIALFVLQARGTTGIAMLFSPIMTTWFVVLAVLGVRGIATNPSVLLALNPWLGLQFIATEGRAALTALGAVFLVVTGGEALYADMGHLGRRPIQIAWFALVLPSLVCNYFGQGAVLLAQPRDAHHAFYHLVPDWGLYPMIVLSTVATVIASQAVISGAYSLTYQAIQLGFLPRFRVVHTSSHHRSQIYIPSLNWMLMFATLWLVFEFGSSDALASAYGVAVTTTMVLTSVLAYTLVTKRWGWKPIAAVPVIGAFLVVDLAFWSSNLLKIPDGGWIPLGIGVFGVVVMTTWRSGRLAVRKTLHAQTERAGVFFERLPERDIARLPGVVVFPTRNTVEMPSALVALVKQGTALREHVVLLTVMTEDVPRVEPERRLEVAPLEAGFYRAIIRRGFMQDVGVPEVLADVEDADLKHAMSEAVYYLGRDVFVPHRDGTMVMWRQRLFGVLARNTQRAATYFDLPESRVIEVGTQVHL